MLPSVPRKTDRRLPLIIQNPYEISGSVQHAKLGRSLESARGLTINESDDLFKFKRSVTVTAVNSSERSHYGSLQENAQRGQIKLGQRSGLQRHSFGYNKVLPALATRVFDQVRCLLPGFSLGVKLEGRNKFLFRFYKSSKVQSNGISTN